MQNTYCSIDLKSFYASVECILRRLDPLDTLLVVADEARSEKTICLAVTPSIKALGVSGRPRLFEVLQALKNANAKRIKSFGSKKSFSKAELEKFQNLQIDCIIAKPRMNTYISFSSQVYKIYLKYIAPKDIHIYSVDEVFINLTPYLKTLTPLEFVSKILKDIYHSLGLVATAGIGSNLYLAKVAMDILAKKITPTQNTLSISYLDEKLYQSKLWNHRPLQDFWRVGKGYAKRLEALGISTMRELAMYALHNEKKLYEIFGINAELLIDHAWGYESCTLQDIKKYVCKSQSKGIGKVFCKGYDKEECKNALKEIVDHLVLSLVSKELKTNHITLDLFYERLSSDSQYSKEIIKDAYGRFIPKPSHGSISIGYSTNSLQAITEKTLELFEKITKPDCPIRKLSLNFSLSKNNCNKEVHLFNFDQIEREQQQAQKEEKMQKARLAITQKFGKNSIFKASSLEKTSLTLLLNSSNGGHRG